MFLDVISFSSWCYSKYARLCVLNNILLNLIQFKV